MINFFIVVTIIFATLFAEFIAREMYKDYKKKKEKKEIGLAIPKKVIQDKVKKCQLSVQMKDGKVFKWTNSSWESVAKEFFHWYFGRPKSTIFVMKAVDSVGQVRTSLLRETILYVETRWVWEDRK